MAQPTLSGFNQQKRLNNSKSTLIAGGSGSAISRNVSTFDTKRLFVIVFRNRRSLSSTLARLLLFLCDGSSDIWCSLTYRQFSLVRIWAEKTFWWPSRRASLITWLIDSHHGMLANTFCADTPRAPFSGYRLEVIAGVCLALYFRRFFLLVVHASTTRTMSNFRCLFHSTSRWLFIYESRDERFPRFGCGTKSNLALLIRARAKLSQILEIKFPKLEWKKFVLCCGWEEVAERERWFHVM